MDTSSVESISLMGFNEGFNCDLHFLVSASIGNTNFKTSIPFVSTFCFFLAGSPSIDVFSLAVLTSLDVLTSVDVLTSLDFLQKLDLTSILDVSFPLYILPSSLRVLSFFLIKLLKLINTLK